MSVRPLRMALVLVLFVVAAGGAQLTGFGRALADVTSYENVVRADQPFVFYPFDESETDTTFHNVVHPGDNALSVGGAHTVPGDNPFSADSTDASLQFSGGVGPQYAETAAALDPLVADNDRTVELWFRTRNSAPQCLVTTGTQAHGQAMSICLTDGNQYASPTPAQAGVYLQFYDADVYMPRADLSDGRWHYLAVSLTGSTVTIDVDGRTGTGYVWDGVRYSSLVSEPFSLPLAPQTAATPMQIGGPTGWAPALSGEIDELAVYQSALGDTSMRSHFDSGVTNPTVSVTPYPVQGVVGRPLTAAQVATFDYVPQPGGTVPPAAAFNVTVDWGDGKTSGAFVTSAPSVLNPAGTSFVVTASHTYAAPVRGSVTVTVSTPLTSAAANAPLDVYAATPSAAFIVNPESPEQKGIGLLMPQTPLLGQRSVMAYVWQFGDTDAVVVDDQQNDKLINSVLSRLATSPNDPFLRTQAVGLGILPADANGAIGWTGDEVLQMVKVWQAYFPQHIVPHAFDYVGIVGVRLTLTDTGGGTSSYVQNPTVNPGCLPWGGPLNNWFGGYTTCDTYNGFAAQFGPHRRADYATFNISQNVPGLPLGIGASLSVVGPVHLGDPIKLYLGAQLTAGVGVGQSVAAQLGWLGPPDPNDAPVTQADVASFVNGVTISGGAALQIVNFGGAFTAVESPTSTYPDGERLAGQKMVGEETALSLGPVSSHLLSVSATASVGCAAPVASIPSQALPQAVNLFDDATSSTPAGIGNAPTDLQTLVTTLTSSNVDIGGLIAEAISNCAGWASRT